MGFIKGLINAVADPRLFFLLAVVALAVLVWKRELVASNTVGYGLLALLAVFFIFGTFDFNFRLPRWNQFDFSPPSIFALLSDPAMGIAAFPGTFSLRTETARPRGR